VRERERARAANRDTRGCETHIIATRGCAHGSRSRSSNSENGGKARLLIRKHDHFTPTREIKRHARALARDHPKGWKLKGHKTGCEAHNQRDRCRSRKEKLRRVSGLSSENQGHNVALTVLCVPYSHDGLRDRAPKSLFEFWRQAVRHVVAFRFSVVFGGGVGSIGFRV